MQTSDSEKNGKVDSNASLTKVEKEEMGLSPKRISSTFSRSTRGKGTEILDDVTKKRENEFWKNNSLFRDS